MREQVRRYLSFDSDLATRFTDAVEAEVHFVCRHPKAAPAFEGEYRKRLLKKPFRFSIVFTVEEHVVVVVAVWAHRRNPTELRERIQRRTQRRQP